jgi:hypothetical protein
MKKLMSMFFVFFLPLSLVISLVNTSCNTKQLKNQILFEFQSGPFKIEKTKEGASQINVEGFEQMQSPGDPILPVNIIDLTIPFNADFKSIKLNYKATYKNIPGQLDIPPAPAYKTRKDNKIIEDWGDKLIERGRNTEVYEKDNYFPLKPVSIITKSQMRKWKFLKIAYVPFQYNPVKHVVRQVEKVIINVDYDTISIAADLSKANMNDHVMDSEAKSRFANFKDASKWYSVNDNSTMQTSEVQSYAIITTNAIVSGLGTTLQSFCDSKINLGYNIIIATENEYGNIQGEPPHQITEKIRSWLTNNYLVQHIKYALLIGNPDPYNQEISNDFVGDIPMKLCWPRRFGTSDREYPTDYYFADLTGNWDLDGDGFFGEEKSSTLPASPDPAIDPLTYSIKWTGKIKAEVSGIYTLSCANNDAIKVVIDGNNVINDFTPHSYANDIGNINLTQGLHNIEIYYFNIDRDGFISLSWSTPQNTATSLIRPDCLFHLSNGEYISGGLDGEYFNDENFTEHVFNRVDSYVYFTWITGDKGDNGVDFTPEIYIGRLPLYNSGNNPDFISAKAILNKIINYENVTPTPNWRKKILLPIKPLDDHTPGYELGESIKDNIAIPLGYEYYRIYEENYGLDPTPEMIPCSNSNVVASWKNGYGLVTWLTHGTEISAISTFNIHDCGNLDDSKPSFTFQASCDNGYPEVPNNLGYSLLKQGAISTISASRVSWYTSSITPNQTWGASQDLAYYYSKSLLEGKRTGDALFLTKSKSISWMNNLAFNIYGDPSSYLLELPDLAVISKNWSISGQQYVINLTIQNIGNAASSEAMIYVNAIDPSPPHGLNEIRIQCEEQLPPLSAGEVYTFSKSIDLYQIHAKEIQIIEVLVDSKNSVRESEENNNQENWIWNNGL